MSIMILFFMISLQFNEVVAGELGTTLFISNVFLHVVYRSHFHMYVYYI